MEPYDILSDETLLRKARECDASIKLFLAEKIILALIMKHCLPEYKDIPIEVIAGEYIENEPEIGTFPVDRDTASRITGANTEDKTVTEGAVYYDIRFLASAPGEDKPIRIIINVEAQKNDTPGYPLIMRALFYCCRMISAQKNVEFEKSRYGDIKKVYSIWICYNSKSYKNTMTRYYITKRDEIGQTREDAARYDLMQVIMLRLGDPESVDSGSILHFLDTVFSKHLTKEEICAAMTGTYNIPVSEKLEERVNDMCNISMGFLEEGISIGEARGIGIGKAEGIDIGKAEGIGIGKALGIRETLKNSILSMKSLKFTDDIIAKALNISPAEVESLAKA